MEVFVFIISISCVVATETATVGKIFQYVIERNKFGFQNLEISNPITFRASLDGFAGLPGWLKYYQEDTIYNGYLYGTPQPTDVGNTTLEIIALNKASYEVDSKKVKIDIQDNKDYATYLAIFNITNKNVDDMLNISEQKTFLHKVSIIWPTENNTLIYNVGRSEKRNSENQEEKEGVIVTVGSTDPFSAELIESYNVSECSANSSDEQMDPWTSLFAPEYTINWCYINLIRIGDTKPVEPTPLYLGGDFDAPEYNPGRIKDIRNSFYMMVVLPIVLAFSFSCVLGYLMFCRREGVLKRNVNTPEEQLICHKNIKKSTKDLRKLNNRRTNSLTSFPSHPNSPASIYQPRFRSNRASEEEPLTSSPAANPEASPPIYRLPPVPAETSFIESKMSAQPSDPSLKPAISRKISSPSDFLRSRESTA